jgi:uncharacterized protein (TIGR02271 family)
MMPDQPWIDRMAESMSQPVPMLVIDKDGLRGAVVDNSPLIGDPETQWLVRFETGQQVVVPKELLKRQKDGTYHLALTMKELLHERSQDKLVQATDELELVVPVVEETLKVQTRSAGADRVEIRKTVHERVEVVDQPLVAEEVEIERVAINRQVEEAVSVRHDGDTLVIPLLEEVLVVEKRLILREEVRIKKVRKETHTPQEVTLREEQVEVVRKAGSANVPA